ncbi:hypothetical protein GCM10009541_59030 [Micromonospora gifhornensis]|uniref:TolB family protein n=1 Tax=Micromonospora gifhornensis TaxID=84594 RepID=UPI001954FFEA|nr:hypothetical protein [Micromonospora gifhornensis]
MNEATAIARDVGKLARGWRATAAAIAVASAVVLSGCGNGPGVEPERLAMAYEGNVEDVAWLPGGQLYVLRSVGSAGPSELALITSGGRGQTVAVRSTAFCGTPEIVTISSLPDGRLGAVVDCEATTTHVSSRIAAVLDDGKVVKLATLGAHWVMSWNENLMDGWVEFVTGRCQSIARYVNGQVAPFPKREPAQLVPFDLDRDFFSPSGCSAPGRAGFLAVGRSGEVFFLVSNEAESIFDERARWHAVAFNPESGIIRQVGPDFTGPYDLAVSPDGTSLLVSGRHNNRLGVWRIDAASGKSSRVLSGRFGAISVSADGRRAAVSRSTSKGDDVVQLDLVQTK